MTTQQPKIIVISKIPSIRKALNLTEEGAKITGLIGYSLEQIGEKNDNKWRIVITRGKFADLLMAVKKTPFLELVEYIEDEGVDVDLSNL